MKTVKFVFCFVLALIAFSQIVSAQNGGKLYVEDELLVKFKDGTASVAARSVNAEIGASILEEFPDLGWQRVKLPADLSVNRAITDYKKFADIEAAQPNFYYHLTLAPNDTRYAELYGMAKISAPAAWDLTTGSQTTVVAIIDTGINYNHQDLVANMWTNAGETNNNGVDDDGNGFVDDYYGYDFFYNDSDPFDQNGHGTHTAGTVGAVGNNSTGVVGVNWNVKLMAIKIYSPNGSDTTSAMLINAYNYVRLMKNRGVNIRVTNNSYGGCGEACGYDQATKNALDAMGNAGILNVFAAGNSGQNIETTPFYPASYTSPSILAVASSTSTDARSGFSNFGAASVDVAAPGTGILSTYNSSNTSYATLSGTSMASPHGAGAAALLSSYNPNLSVASLKATLMNTVDALAQWNGVVKTGGRLNVDRALRNQTVCNFALSQTSVFIPGTGGGNFTVNVSAPTNCDYAATSNANWITVTNGNPGSGNGTISFTVQNNPIADVQRVSTITIGNQTYTVTQGTNFVARTPVLDFDGDGKTDYSVLQAANGTMFWHNYQSANGYAPVNFGASGVSVSDFPIPADFDGDGKTDIAVFRPSTGVWYILWSSNGTIQTFQFGQEFDSPSMTQDFDGDNKADYTLTRYQNGSLFWYIYGSTSGFRALQFGSASDKPIRGDYDGDGKADIAVYRRSHGSPANTFFIQKSSDNQVTARTFGVSTSDNVVPGDYDGDGKTDIAVWRATTGVWYYVKSSDGSFGSSQFGQANDLPTPGDYDGDGRTDFAVWRREANANGNGYFYAQRSTAGFSAFGWGNSQMSILAYNINEF
jgi:subtilisin family serine protease